MSTKALHLFQSYLPATQNWCYSTLTSLSDTKVIIGAHGFLHNNFYDERFEYIEFPISQIDESVHVPGRSCFNQVVRKLQRHLYPWYLVKAVNRPDVVHSHFATAGWDFLSVSERLRVPHIVSFYGYDYERLPHTNPIWKKRYKSLFEKADLFLCEGAHGGRLLERQGCPPEKIRVCHLGVRISGIETIARKKDKGELRLLQIATMSQKKGHIYTLEAFLQALPDCPNMHLTFVGGEMPGNPAAIEEPLKARVREENAEEKVSFIPRISFERLHEFLGDFHAFIHPSVYADNFDSEGGAPVVLLDAQATGMPVLATRHCDIPDEVIDQSTGVLVDEKDVRGLAEAITRFYRMPQGEYDGFAKRAREHVESNYDIEKNARDLQRVYEGLRGVR